MLSDTIYEKLNNASSIRGFITLTVSIFDEAIDQLINRVFRKTDFAVKSVVDSLFVTSGPLFELNIRLKVLLGLGVISHETFEDINAFITIKEKLNNDEKEYAFSDGDILIFVQNLYHQQDKMVFNNIEIHNEHKDSLTYKIQQLRLERLVRSCLILIIAAIYNKLQIESPL